MCELWNELNERFQQADKVYQRRLHSGYPVSDRLIKRHRDLKICLDALASIDGDLVDVFVSDSSGDGNNPAPPQRELRRQEDREQ